MATNSLLQLALFVTVYFTFSLLCFAWGLIKWSQFSRHFLILKRFPKITLIIAIATIIELNSIIAERWYSYGENYTNRYDADKEVDTLGIFFAFPQICAFIITALLCYRLLLIYYKYKASQKDANKLSLSLADEKSMSITSRSESNDVSEINNESGQVTTQTGRLSTICITIYIIICSILIAVAHVNTKYLFFIQYAWTSVIIFGIVSIILVKCKHVKEGIGCLHEAYVTLSYTLLTLILNTLYGVGNPVLIYYLNIMAMPIQGLLPLLFGIYLIYKCEGTLDVNLWRQKHDDDLYVEYSMSDSNISSSPQASHQVIEIDLTVNVFKFLDKRKANYKLFASYLSYCFALESLLFVQNVSVFHEVINTQFIKKIDKSEQSQSEEPQQGEAPSTQSITRVKLKYLTKKHNDFKDRMAPLNGKTQFDAECCEVLYTVSKMIYDEFISVDSLNEINISSTCRKQLIFLLETKDNINKFTSFRDFATVFDTAMVQVYKLLLSMYSYRFVEYTKDKQNE